MATQFRVTSATELRRQPKRSAPVIATLAAGAIVARTGRKERRWVPVSHQGQSGWIGDRFLERVDTPDSDQEWAETEIVNIIRQAARDHGQPEDDLLRVGRCESNLDPRAVNPAGPYFGLFQFLRSTWGSTPFAERDIFDPVANANAAAWMWQQGRRDEWVCQ